MDRARERVREIEGEQYERHVYVLIWFCFRCAFSPRSTQRNRHFMVVNNNHSNNHTPIVVAPTAKYQKQQQKERKQPFQAQNSDAR